MLEDMPASLLYEWIEYFSLESFDFQLDNYRSGLITSAILNVNRQKSTDKVWSPQDFFPDLDKQNKTQSVEQMEMYAEYISLAFNSPNVRKGG